MLPKVTGKKCITHRRSTLKGTIRNVIKNVINFSYQSGFFFCNTSPVRQVGLMQLGSYEWTSKGSKMTMIIFCKSHIAYFHVHGPERF